VRSKKYKVFKYSGSCITTVIFAILILASCTKEREIIQEIDYNYIYGIDTVYVYQSAADKTKQKTSYQYTSILYADLHQKSIPTNDLNEISRLTLAIGDKQLVNEMLLSNYLNSGNAIIPSNTEMRNDVGQFIEDTYKRFYLRKPTEIERYYLINLIESDTSITPEIVYSSFALSNEYLFY